MKRVLLVLLALLLLCAAPPVCAAAEGAALTPVDQLADAQGNVIFSDPLVEQGVRDCLMVYDGPITVKQLAGMGSKYTPLSLTSAEPVTVDLSILQLCPKLKMLMLDGVTPADWSAVGSLKGMTYLSVRRADLSDLGFLAGHKKLMDLALYEGSCGDISAVTQIPKLITFRTDQPISDLTPLYACKKLKGVSLAGLTDAQINTLLDAFGKKLNDLGLKDCAPTDATVTRIAGLKLQSLSLDNVTLSSVAPLFGIKTLKYSLDLYNMNIPSLDGLQNLTKVMNVTLDNVTGVSDYGPLYQMAGVRMLALNDCPAPNLAGIEGMKKLTSLYLQNLTGTLAMAPVYGLAKLQTLGLFSVTVDTLAGVEGMAKLSSLMMYSVQGLTDYTPLSGLKRIQSISTDTPDLLPAGLPVY